MFSSFVLRTWYFRAAGYSPEEVETLSNVPLDKPAVALAVAPLGDWVGVALPDGRVLGLDLQEASG